MAETCSFRHQPTEHSGKAVHHPTFNRYPDDFTKYLSQLTELVIYQGTLLILPSACTLLLDGVNCRC